MNSPLFLCLFLGNVCGNDTDLQIIDSIKQDQRCIQNGGVCTIATDCPPGKLVEQKGLCGHQCDLDVECCYGVKETRCKKRGGDCVEDTMSSNPDFIVSNITDCPQNHKCYVFVN